MRSVNSDRAPVLSVVRTFIFGYMLQKYPKLPVRLCSGHKEKSECSNALIGGMAALVDGPALSPGLGEFPAAHEHWETMWAEGDLSQRALFSARQSTSVNLWLFHHWEWGGSQRGPCPCCDKRCRSSSDSRMWAGQAMVEKLAPGEICDG